MEDNTEYYHKSSFIRVYPKPLPPIHPSNEVDSNGFTAMERTTLRSAWRLLKPQQLRISRSIWINFLTKNELQIEVFRSSEGKLKLDKLHAHAENAIQLIGDIIEKHLELPLEFRNRLEQCMPIHNNYHISLTSMLKFVDEIFFGFLGSSVLQNQKSTTLSNALDKLLTIVSRFNSREEERKITQSIKYSVVQHMYSDFDNPKSNGHSYVSQLF